MVVDVQTIGEGRIARTDEPEKRDRSNCTKAQPEGPDCRR
jgi:hypothetical protein